MRDTAYSLGHFLGSLAPLAIGIAVSFWLRKRRGGDKLPGWPIIVGLVLTILSCTGATRSQAATAPKIRVVSYSEPANGLTEAKMTPEFLQALNDSWAESYRQSRPDKAIDPGLSFAPHYVNYPERRLAVVEMRLNQVAIGAAVFGLVGNNFTRVICLDRAGAAVDLRTGECGQKIREVFGVSIPAGERG